ncbi:flagellar hook capping FlgD N-terminal domain-containing protein [Vibrio sp. PP-XX7]
MVAQIQNQDPLNPLDGTEYVSQLAQFLRCEYGKYVQRDAPATRYYSITCRCSRPPDLLVKRFMFQQ